MNINARAVARAFLSARKFTATSAAAMFANWASIVFLGSLSACTLTPPKPLTFTNPPAIGQSLPNGQRFFACDKIRGARYMASTGFMIAGCTPLQPSDAHKFRVNTIERVDLPEGEMWQIQLIGPEGSLWMALPWHDWA